MSFIDSTVSDRFGVRSLRMLVLGLLVVTAPLVAFQLGAAAPDVTRPQPEWSDPLFVAAENSVGTYNERVDAVDQVKVWGMDLGRLRGMIVKERVNVYVVDRDDGTAVFSFRTTKDGRIVDLRHRKRGDATVRVVTDRRTAERIRTEFSHVRALKKAFVEGRIRIEGVGSVNRMKWWAIDRWVRSQLSESETGSASPPVEVRTRPNGEDLLSRQVRDRRNAPGLDEPGGSDA